MVATAMVVAFSGFSGCWEIGCEEEGEGREKERGGEEGGEKKERGGKGGRRGRGEGERRGGRGEGEQRKREKNHRGVEIQT